MSKTLLRGLELIEIVGAHGSMTVTEIAREMGLEPSIVSRTVAACEADGWLTRVNGKIGVGPRSALLGLTSPTAEAIHRADPLIRALAGVLGVTASAGALIGREAMTISSMTDSGVTPLIPLGVATRVPVHLMAEGRAIAAQLDTDQLSALLPPEPYPLLPPEPYPAADQLFQNVGAAVPEFIAGLGHEGPALTPPRTRAELDAVIATIRADGFSRDTGQVHPKIYCISRPWPAAGLPAAISCLGFRDDILGGQATIEACLIAATAAGATVQDVVGAAAAAYSF